jgi:hypothetical protein
MTPPINGGVTAEVGKQVSGFMTVMREQPLSLALVVMNFLLVAFLFYSNSQVLKQREDALNQIVKWQSQTDNLMANCVSKDVMQLVINAMERDRQLARSLLPMSPFIVPGAAPLVFPAQPGLPTIARDPTLKGNEPPPPDPPQEPPK